MLHYAFLFILINFVIPKKKNRYEKLSFDVRGFMYCLFVMQ
jgi:hypothetical protein